MVSPLAALADYEMENDGSLPLGKASTALAISSATKSEKIWDWWGGWGSNPGPTDYESAALTG